MIFSSLPSDTTRETVTRQVSAMASLNQVTSRVERSLLELPDRPQKPASSPVLHSPQPSLCQMAIGMTSGFAPAAGLARCTVERMGRVWGSKMNLSGPLPFPHGESPSTDRTRPHSHANSNHLESLHHAYVRRVCHHPRTPSVSSTASSLSDHEGPQLSRCLRDPVHVPGVGGLVFGRELRTSVEETAIDSPSECSRP
jgi:hypothetical protein